MQSSVLQSPTERDAVRAFLARLREHRLALNLSQVEMAKRAGMSPASYQNIELGVANPTLSLLVRLLGILGGLKGFSELLPPVEPERTLQSLDVHARMRATGSNHKARRTP
jgi:transcriptional regulator with XRE-family HTH domain